MRRRSVRVVLPLMLMALLAAACTDKDLETLAASLRSVSQSIGTLQQTVISANGSNPKLISDDSTRAILQICVRINQAGLEADKIARELNALTPQDRSKLNLILDPIALSISTIIASSGDFGITDDRTRSAVMFSLLAIQTALNGAKLALVR